MCSLNARGRRFVPKWWTFALYDWRMNSRVLEGAEAQAAAPSRWIERLLWIDGGAGAAVGVLVLALMGWLAVFYRLPLELVRFMGVMNLVYGAYSLTLASRRRRPLAAIVFLVLANTTWAVLCVRWAIVHGSTASVFGHLQLLGEALFVGGLAAIEWRVRHQLVERRPSAGPAP